MRGEHRNAINVLRAAVGSSPHARGARGSHGFGWCVGGIIPACAGSTKAALHQSASGGDHPRMRGEHYVKPIHTTSPAGSSPHARGARAFELSYNPSGRIIPACAGSTWEGWSLKCGRSDHPRMRGEHPPSSWTMMVRMGSSPHARGAHPIFDEAHRPRRIIPACAGSTPPPST